jgi:hypothetical protein
MTSVLAINKYMTCFRNDSHKSDILRRYLKHKVGKLMQQQNRKPKILLLFGFPINLLLF